MGTYYSIGTVSFNQFVTITFQVKISTTVPTPNPLFNNSQVIYTIIVSNSGNVTAQNIIFKDTIPNGTILIPSSVFVNGVLQSGANPSNGVSIPNVSPGSVATLMFKALVSY